MTSFLARISSLAAASSWTLAVGIAALAYLSPVSQQDADGGIGLLAAQALVEHGTLNLEVYQDRPELAYDLGSDYRLIRRGGATLYHSLGYPLLTAPPVWIANRFGLDMVRRADEGWLQNALSALTCGLIFLLLEGACRALVGRWPALVVATVTVLGSPLISTLGTALWSVNLALPLVCLALLVLAPTTTSSPSAATNAFLSRPGLREWAAVLLLAPAVLVRPSVGFFVIALLLGWWASGWRRTITLVVGLAGALGLWWTLESTVFATSWPDYYSLSRLSPQALPAISFPGVLWSPSRGLLVWCPFVLPILAVVGALLAKTWRQPLGRLLLMWLVLLLVAIGFKGMWWGGHGYGPRLLAEAMPAFGLLAALGWRLWRSQGPSARRVAAAGLYLILAVPAIWIHSVQGLFNREVVRWNRLPNIDRNTELLFDWRYPQFLASDRQIAEREIELRRPALRPYELGRRIGFASHRALYAGWYPPETKWRWSHSRRADVVLDLSESGAADELHALEIVAGARGSQEVAVFLDDAPLGSFELRGFEPQRALVEVPGALLPAGERRLTFQISNPSTAPADDRLLGIALQSLRLFGVEPLSGRVAHGDDTWFVSGFAIAEASWRWTVGERAEMSLPLDGAVGSGDYVLELEAGALGAQSVRLFLNGQRLDSQLFLGFQPQTRRIAVPRELLRRPGLNRLRLEIPDARPAPGDPRRLGLAVTSVDLRPVE